MNIQLNLSQYGLQVSKLEIYNGKNELLNGPMINQFSFEIEIPHYPQ